jgi:hypothetical protein
MDRDAERYTESDTEYREHQPSGMVVPGPARRSAK